MDEEQKERIKQCVLKFSKKNTKIKETKKWKILKQQQKLCHLVKKP